MVGSRIHTTALRGLGLQLALVLSLTAYGQAASDACSFAAANRYTVNTSCTFSNFDKPTSFVANLSPATCGGGNFDDAFGWFAGNGTTIFITYDPDDFDNPIMHLYSGTCASLTYLMCINANGNGGAETISLATTIGTNYLVRIQRSGTNSSMDGRLCVWSPPVNDNCSAAIDLPVFDACFNQTFTNVGATASGTNPNPACSTTPSTDVWFRFVAPGSGAVIVETTAGSLTDGAMQIYSGSCGGLSLVGSGCDDDSGPGAMPRLDRRCAPLTGGATYFIRFWGYNGATGTFGICVYGPDLFPTPQQDCGGGFTVCNSGPINNSSNWTGCVADLSTSNRGCLGSNERQGTWYYFSPQATGTVGFSLQPINNMGVPVNIDYDFAIWGPMNSVVCPPSGGPLRCSYAAPGSAGTYLTGMATGNVDVSEDASGAGVNGFTAPLTIGAAQVGKLYVLYLDNYSSTGQAFNLTWSLGAPNQLDCSLLPVEILTLDAEAGNGSVEVKWTAQSTGITAGYEVQHSNNGVDFRPIGYLPSDATAATTDHLFDHKDPVDGVNYYRLKLVQGESTDTYSDMVSAFFQRGQHVIVPRPNPANTTLQMELPTASSDAYDVLITDASGRLAQRRSALSTGPSTTVSLDLVGLDPGCYLIHVVDNRGTTLGTGRFVKE